MKSGKFPSHDDAKKYLEERGVLKYWGREGADAKNYVYTLTVGIKVYHILLHENGTMRVMDQTYN